MLTDHNESFGRTEFPDVLLYRADRGDQLVTRDGKPVANRLACPDGAAPPLLLAGTESGLMPVGLEGHLPGTIAERQAVYGDVSAAAIAQFADAGALTLAQHTEDWTVDQLSTLPLAGFEMYNLHRNLMSNMAGALELLMHLDEPDAMPAPDLVLLPVFREDQEYLDKWSAVLAGGARRVTTMATDCHRNSLPAKLADGERVDSYRRMMLWFSNHILVVPGAGGAVDDRSLKDALAAGRLYGAFELLGYPVGFDFRAVVAGVTHEMGETVSLTGAPELTVTLPHVDDLDPTAEAPSFLVRIHQAQAAGWKVVAEGPGDLVHKPATKGVYRAEVRMVPRHLRSYLGAYQALAEKDLPWVWANPIYVTD
jgi:hypothetical protein